MSDETKLTKEQLLELERQGVFMMMEDERFEEFFGPRAEYDATTSTKYGNFHCGKLWVALQRAKGELVERKGRGGKRPGSGRPKRKEVAATEKKTVRLTPQELSESMELLEEGESWSEMVRRLIRRSVMVERELQKRRSNQGGQEET